MESYAAETSHIAFWPAGRLEGEKQKDGEQHSVHFRQRASPQAVPNKWIVTYKKMEEKRVRGAI